MHRDVISVAALESRLLLSTTIAVNTFADRVDPPGSATVSLRDALAKAEGTSGAVTVAVPGGTYFLTLGQLVISSTSGQVTVQPISGTAALVGISSRVVHVESGATVTLSGTDISDGSLSRFPYSNDDRGGGIFNEGMLTVTHSTVHDNGGEGASGGGVYNSGTMTIDSSSISDNSVSGPSLFESGSGGGISSTGTLTIANSTISGNEAGASGGIYSSGTLTMTVSTVSDNFAYQVGGGIDNHGTLKMANSTVANNSVLYDGGGIANYFSATLTNCTITGNTASLGDAEDARGGGVFNNDLFQVANTIIAGNSVSAPNANAIGPDVANAITSQGHNLIGQTDGSSGWVGSDLTGTTALPLDPKLSLVLNQGGPTATALPLPGSPAIDHGSNALAPSGTKDQRGLSRIFNGTVDIGADEAQAAGGSISGTIFTDDDDQGPATVYNDANNNGKLDPGELTQITYYDDQFQFAGLAAGSYKIREVVPPGVQQTSPSNGFGWSVSLAANQAASGKDFVRHTVASGIISGSVGSANGLRFGITVYNDANNDAKLDNNELSTVTDAHGNYSFQALAAGSYKIREIVPPGWIQTTPSNNFGFTVTLANQANIQGLEFVQQSTPPGGPGAITGTVFNDVNNDHLQEFQNPTERGLSGWTVYIDSNNDGIFDNGDIGTLTRDDGGYFFIGLSAGNYVIRTVTQKGWTQTAPAGGLGQHIAISSSGKATGKGTDFGEHQNAG